MTDDYVFDNYITNQSNLINESPYIQVNPPIYIEVYPPLIISVNPPQNIPANPPQNIPVNQINQEQLSDSLNSIEIKKVMKILRQNPNLFNQFNEEVKRDNNNFNKQSIFNDSNYINMASKGEVPRKIFSQIKKSNEKTPFNTDNNPNMINVCFGLSTGQSFNEKASKNMIIKIYV
jgi:hypothetical protein